jgi:hypothetical protein
MESFSAIYSKGELEAYAADFDVCAAKRAFLIHGQKFNDELARLNEVRKRAVRDRDIGLAQRVADAISMFKSSVDNVTPPSTPLIPVQVRKIICTAELEGERENLLQQKRREEENLTALWAEKEADLEGTIKRMEEDWQVWVAIACAYDPPPPLLDAHPCGNQRAEGA